MTTYAIVSPMNETLQISREAAERVLPCLEAQLEGREHDKARAEADIAQLKITIVELRAKLAGSELPLNGKQRERRPKGHGEKLITEVLASLPNGGGLSATEIAKKTGVNYATVFRALNTPERNKGRFVGVDGKWTLKK